MTDNPEYFDETLVGKQFRGLELRADGYIGNFDYRNTAEIIPFDNTGSYITKMCDYHYVGEDNTTARTLLVGGRANDGGAAGLAYWHSDSSLAYVHPHVGFRLVYYLD